MKDTSRRLSVRRCLAGLAAALAIAAAGAQVPTQLPPIGTPVPGTMPQQAPTAEQLQMLQQLPEAERQALMRALGISPLTGMQPGAGSALAAACTGGGSLDGGTDRAADAGGRRHDHREVAPAAAHTATSPERRPPGRGG